MEPGPHVQVGNQDKPNSNELGSKGTSAASKQRGHEGDRAGRLCLSAAGAGACQAMLSGFPPGTSSAMLLPFSRILSSLVSCACMACREGMLPVAACPGQRLPGPTPSPRAAPPAQLRTAQTSPAAHLLALGRDLVLDDILQNHVHVDVKSSARGRRMAAAGTAAGTDAGLPTLPPEHPTWPHLSVPTISLSPRSRIHSLLPMHRSTSSEGRRWLGLFLKVDL